eukprot:scaffold38106_cov49-Phaeocystis_antarctica.AAC.2
MCHHGLEPLQRLLEERVGLLEHALDDAHLVRVRAGVRVRARGEGEGEAEAEGEAQALDGAHLEGRVALELTVVALDHQPLPQLVRQGRRSGAVGADEDDLVRVGARARVRARCRARVEDHVLLARRQHARGGAEQAHVARRQLVVGAQRCQRARVLIDCAIGVELDGRRRVLLGEDRGHRGWPHGELLSGGAPRGAYAAHRHLQSRADAAPPCTGSSRQQVRASPEPAAERADQREQQRYVEEHAADFVVVDLTSTSVHVPNELSATASASGTSHPTIAQAGC